MKRVEINLNQMHDEEEVYECLREKLGVQEYEKGNMEFLYKELVLLPENICVELSCCRDEASPVYELGKKLERVIEDAAQTVQYMDETTMFAVFAHVEPLGGASFW